MTIELYSKKGCGICDAAKDKLSRMGLDFRSFDLQALIEVHDGWREDGSIEVMAAYAWIGNRLPVIRIGGEFHDYPGAMKRLKSLTAKSASQEETTH